MIDSLSVVAVFGASSLGYNEIPSASSVKEKPLLRRVFRLSYIINQS